MKKFFFFSLSIAILLFFPGCGQDKSHEAHEHEEAEDAGIDSHEGEEHHDDESGETVSDSYTLLTLRKQPFSMTVRTGGQISVDSRDVVMVTAKSSGLVNLSNDFLFPGVKVSRGDILFTISGQQLAENNTELNFIQIKADLELATANFERAQKLIGDKIITQSDYLSAKNEYEKLLSVYENLNATFGSNGNIVPSGATGYIREIFVTEGQKVSPGDPLASIVIEHYHVLRADLSPDHGDVMSRIVDATFTVGYSDRVYRVSELNGRKISQGKSMGVSSFYIPVYFRLDYHPDLIDGTFAEVYLKGDKIDDALVVPNSALMEEFGNIYVFVADDDGDFVKRYVKTGYSDGESTMIISGLSEGETIVATGAFRIKLSQMSTTAPSHAHDH